MKQGMTFDDVKAQVAHEAEHRNDFFAPTNQLRLEAERVEGKSHLLTPQGRFGLRDTAHLHLAEVTGIDRRYYQRLRRESPALLAENVNYWLAQGGSKPRLVRALESDVRALASVRYATLDNDALLTAVEPILNEIGASVESCELDDEGITLKLVTPKLQGEVQKGDVVQAGLLIKNSEVRAGALLVQPLIFRLVCTNGLILGGVSGQAASRRHISRDWREDKEYFGQVLQSDERVIWEREIWQQLQGQIRAVINDDAFQNIISKLSATTRLQSTLEPDALLERLELLGAEYKIGPELQAQVIGHLHADNFRGTLWDVINGFTRVAQDVTSYEMSTSLERLGGRLAELNPRQWERLTSVN